MPVPCCMSAVQIQQNLAKLITRPASTNFSHVSMHVMSPAFLTCVSSLQALETRGSPGKDAEVHSLSLQLDSMHSSLLQLKQQQQAFEQQLQQQAGAASPAAASSQQVSGLTAQLETMRQMMTRLTGRVDVLDAHLQQEQASSLQALEAILSDTSRA